MRAERNKEGNNETPKLKHPRIMTGITIKSASVFNGDKKYTKGKGAMKKVQLDDLTKCWEPNSHDKIFSVHFI